MKSNVLLNKKQVSILDSKRVETNFGVKRLKIHYPDRAQSLNKDILKTTKSKLINSLQTSCPFCVFRYFPENTVWRLNRGIINIQRHGKDTKNLRTSSYFRFYRI